MNTTVVPCEGLWDVSRVKLDYARIVVKGSFTSAVGHESTAQLMTTLLGKNVPVNRIHIQPKKDDSLLCFKLKQRAPEGKILTLEELEELGYEFYVMTMLSHSKNQFVTDMESHKFLTSRIKQLYVKDDDNW